ncbi:iron-containing alcohol dehydrogenase [Gemmatimonas groenlandica]|uniref:Iron-containing alcohol dehydrogenase n=1 Tax=Gemmatimonas groenlandica TaxID=2732249 RepID=A0A6M4IUM7_9BACT|nr:iron-containing alcohol dehydrogenase [Gemmatimonas groenlandica]QJR37848.1 iron-containing alcohol dehydrogenase [Gemmatimonas groenlandica]
MSNFSFETTPRVICADGESERLGGLLREFGINRPLVVTDPGIVSAGLLEPMLASLRALGIDVTVFDDVVADPPASCVEAAVATAQASHIDGVIGFGGGSSLDVAKLVALLSRSGESLEAVYGVGLAGGPRWPLIQVPTTAGTGSEVTPIAIVTTPSGEKQGVVSRLLYPNVAVLDATLTLGLPARVTAMTGIDAMVHAIEAYTSRHAKNVLSDTLAVRALRLLSDHIGVAIENGTDLAARRAMLQGSMLAGMAFANAPVGAVHALAYPLGGQFHVPHGLSNALVLLPVLEFNLSEAEPLYRELADAVRAGERTWHRSASGRAFVDAMATIVGELGLERTLGEVGIIEADLPSLATDAMKVQRLLVNNPRDVDYDQALALYREAL